MHRRFSVDRYFNPINQTDPMLIAIEVYSETMANMLKKKFGKDLFTETMEKTTN